MTTARALAQLRHVYHLLHGGHVKDQKQFADGVLHPAIAAIEQALPAFVTDHQRMWDLVRFARGYLLDEGLISRQEYGVLVANETETRPGIGSPSPRRLESYDELRAKLAALEEKAAAFDDRLLRVALAAARAGFDASSEGYNGEFHVMSESFESDWNEKAAQMARAAIGAEP